MGLLFYHVPNIFLPYDTFFDNEMWESSVEIQIFFRSISLLSIIVTIYFPSCRYIIICYEFKGITTLKVVYKINKNLFIYNIKKNFFIQNEISQIRAVQTQYPYYVIENWEDKQTNNSHGT